MTFLLCAINLNYQWVVCPRDRGNITSCARITPPRQVRKRQGDDLLYEV